LDRLGTAGQELTEIRVRFREPAPLPGVGWVVASSICAAGSWVGRSVDLVLVGEDGGGLDEVVDRVAARLAALEQPGAGQAALAAPLGETLGLPEAEYTEALFAPRPEDVARRAAALELMTARWAEQREHVARTWGLRLPEHLAVWAALWHSLSPYERRGLQLVGWTPAGLTTHLVGTTGFGEPADERLTDRYWCDPPEFATVVRGDSDGLHYGLWYDDPALTPSLIAGCYAKDDPSVFTHHSATVLAELRYEIADMLQYRCTEAEREEYRWPLHALGRAVDAFADADARALAREGGTPWRDAPRVFTGGGLGPALPPDSGDPRGGTGWSQEVMDRRDDMAAAGPAGDAWIATARSELAAGKPAFALVLGRELFQRFHDAYQPEGLELLTGAYRALGRDALATIAETHAAHRT